MKSVLAALLLLRSPVLGQGQGPGQGPVSGAASSIYWTSANTLSALFKDKATVKRFLDEIAKGDDPRAPEATPEVYEYRFVDLNDDGRLELVALVGGWRLATFLDVVFQAPDGAPPADRLSTNHDGFVLRTLPGFDIGDLNAVLRDLDHDGTCEIVVPQVLGGYAGTANPQATMTEIFSWDGSDLAKVSARFPEFYRDEVLPRLGRQLQKLEALPAPADPRDRAERRAERENIVRGIAEARKRAQRQGAPRVSVCGVWGRSPRPKKRRAGYGDRTRLTRLF